MDIPPPLDCGTCELCCRVLAIETINKPALDFCPHQQRGHAGRHGCKIYPERPQACRRFTCAWLASQTHRQRPGQMPLPPELRPDRCHVVLTPDPFDRLIVHLNVDPDYPQAWRREPVRSYVGMVLRRGAMVSVIVGGQRRVMKVGEPVYRGRAAEWRLERGNIPIILEA